ncbi:MAG: hypothetical protein ACT4QG_15590 [Sporichthyaceae bacterium]
MSVARAHEVADELFERHGATFGANLPTYRGHVHRVVGLVGLQTAIPEEKAGAVGVAAFFHDAGIWFDRTWDYLPPSARRAVEEIGSESEYAGLVDALVGEHHRLRRAKHGDPLVEAFRRADLTDVTAGLIGVPGASRRDYRSLSATYSAKGFRPMLVKAFGRGLREKPWNPAPMLKF